MSILDNYKNPFEPGGALHNPEVTDTTELFMFNRHVLGQETWDEAVAKVADKQQQPNVKYYVINLGDNYWGEHISIASKGKIENIKISVDNANIMYPKTTTDHIIDALQTTNVSGIAFIAIIGIHGRGFDATETYDGSYTMYSHLGHKLPLSEIYKFASLNFITEAIIFLSACNAGKLYKIRNKQGIIHEEGYAKNLSSVINAAVIGANDQSKGTYVLGTYNTNPQTKSVYNKFKNGILIGNYGKKVTTLQFYKEAKKNAKNN